MPWMETTKMSQRQEFVLLAMCEEVNFRELCRRFGISPVTGYKWKQRYEQAGPQALADRSRRPMHSPAQTSPQIERLAVEVRRQHPAWGGRKIKARLKGMGYEDIPAASTITGILHRHGLINPEDAAKHAPFTRFEWPEPNDLWQMDFKGDFALPRGRCYPLTVLDDHSRFNLAIRACSNQRGKTVQPRLTEVFRQYGLPWRILCDNGPPWGASSPGGGLTHLGAWLIRMGITLCHGRAFHPQTQGKEERFHRSMKAEVLKGRSFADLDDTQRAFDPWRDVYNFQRPHEALDMATPASRYRPSPRSFPEILPPVEYAPDDQVRHADHNGYVTFHRRRIHVSDAVAHQPVGFRHTDQDGILDVYFCHQKIDRIDLRSQDVRRERC